MNRLIVTVLVAGLSLIATPAHAYENHYTHHQRESCRFERNDRWNDTEVRDVIRCVSRHFGVSTSTALRVANCESHYKAYAVSASGTYVGVFQHSRSEWPSRQNWADRHNRWNIKESAFDARANTIVAMRMVRGGGWGAWSCY